MYVSIQTIRQQFPEKDAIQASFAKPRGLIGYHVCSDSIQPERQYLYQLQNLSQLDQIKPKKDMHFLVFRDPEDSVFQGRLYAFARKYQADILGLAIDPKEEVQVQKQLDRFFQSQIAFACFSDSLLSILAEEKGIQEMVEHTFMFLENPVFVFDSDFMLMAANWEELEKFPKGKKYIEEKGLTQDAFPLLNNLDHIHTRVLKSEKPIRVLHPEIGVEQIVCAINTERDLGHIVLCAINREFRDYDFQAIKLLATAINDQLQKDVFIRNNQGFNYELFIADLLDQKIATDRQFQDRLSYVNASFTEINYCLIADLARSTRTVHPAHIRDTFEKILPGAKALIYHGELVVILSKEDSLLTAEEAEKIRESARKYGIYCGISNPFCSILDLRSYYEQALRSIELGICRTDAPSLFFYSDYALDHVKHILRESNAAKAFVHPFLQILQRYDESHRTDFVRTWFLYLVHERNLVNTAAAMYLHRNTLAYHLKKIQTLAEQYEFNFDSFQERAYYMMSFELILAN